MKILIKSQNTWQVYESIELPMDEKNWIVKIETWRANIDFLWLRKFPVVILVTSDSELFHSFFEFGSEVHLENIAFITMDFPAFTDGKGFSLVRIIRNKFWWASELRANGNVLNDTTQYLARCGFDSFLVKESHDANQALNALQTFSVHYQKSYTKQI